MSRSACNRRCGPLTGSITAQDQALPLEPLKAMADVLLDVQGAGHPAVRPAANGISPEG